MRKLTAIALVFAAAVAIGAARPVHVSAVVELNDTMVETAVLPWVQTVANGDPVGPEFIASGDMSSPSWASLAPAGDTWQAGASVSFQNNGGTFSVLSVYGGVTRVDVVQPGPGSR